MKERIVFKENILLYSTILIIIITVENMEILKDTSTMNPTRDKEFFAYFLKKTKGYGLPHYVNFSFLDDSTGYIMLSVEPGSRQLAEDYIRRTCPIIANKIKITEHTFQYA